MCEGCYTACSVRKSPESNSELEWATCSLQCLNAMLANSAVCVLSLHEN